MHQPVLLAEVMELMGVKAGGTYVDGTLGGGGHAAAILERAGERGRLLGIDRDEEALARTGERLSKYGARCVLEHGDFADMTAIAQRQGIEGADGVLLDLGMSSDQVDSPERGFSFQQDGPLDMRMDRSRGMTAADIVNTYDEKALADLLWAFGEESASRRIARTIVETRKGGAIETTARLADIVARAKGRGRSAIHPATKTFQALRMAVNHEMESLAQGLEAALGLTVPGGRVAVISFHSLEDRMVKQTFAKHAGRIEALPAGGSRWAGEEPKVARVTRKPVTASEAEVRENPRSRSAKLRVVERI